MKTIIAVLLLGLVATSAYADCSVFKSMDINIAWYDHSSKYTTEPLDIPGFSAEGFKALPYIGEDFPVEECRNTMFKYEIIVKETSEKFVALVTSTHECDGGNTFGVLYAADGTTVVAGIYDGFIECK